MAKNTLRTQQNKAVVRPECKNRTSTPRPKPKHQRPHSLLNILCSVFKERTKHPPHTSPQRCPCGLPWSGAPAGAGAARPDVLGAPNGGGST